METEKVTIYTYWRHIWTGMCHRAEVGKEWRLSLWEQITQDVYEDWIWERRKIWTWDKKMAYEELGLELL